MSLTFWIFLSLAGGAAFLLVFALIFGHDHDHDHDIGGHEAGHGHDGHGHDGEESTVSIFSTKVIYTFVMSFGAAGAISTYCGLGEVVSSLIGAGSGIILGLVVFAGLRLLYSQQGSTKIDFTGAVGKNANVITSITDGGLGSINTSIQGALVNFTAKAVDNKEFKRGSMVRIVDLQGSIAIVDIIPTITTTN